MVHVNDILHFLVGRSGAPSAMGAQLDRLRLGFSPAPDPFRAREEVETHLLEQAQLLRCIDAFADKREFREPTNRQAVAYKTLERLQLASKRAQGEIALGVLRAYHERCTVAGLNQERATLEVYRYLATIAPSVAQVPPDAAAEAFADPKDGKKPRALACEAYADALLALNQHVRVWNKRG